MRVLVVEDQVKMAALLRRGLSDDGLVVDVAGSGEDALWMASSTPYDAVVLDVMLPGIDGFEVCRRLRADDVWAPVLLLTARDAVQDLWPGSTWRRRLPRQAVSVPGHLSREYLGRPYPDRLRTEIRDLPERPAGRACVHVRRPPRIGLRSETGNLGVMP